MTPSLILLAALLILFLCTKAFFLNKLGISAIPGYLLLGIVVRLIHDQTQLFLDVEPILTLLGKIGIVLLLFHVGLETHFRQLLKYFNRAGVIALCNIILSGLLGFSLTLAFGLSVMASLFVGTALTATSIGVSTASWNKRDLSKKAGVILLDLVTLDDIIAVLLMAMLFNFASYQGSGLEVSKEVLFFFIKISALILGCYLFSYFAEPWIMKELIKYERVPDSLLTVIAIGLIGAGIAALIQFSLAIGAFFAGVAFSRDPKAVRMEASMQLLLDLFVPFFFFWIAYNTQLAAIHGYWLLCIGLFAVAVLGKFLGTWIPARLIKMGGWGALLISVSMIPRAEISMIIMEYGLEHRAISESLYSVVSLVALATCFLAPYLIKTVNRAGRIDRISY